MRESASKYIALAGAVFLASAMVLPAQTLLLDFGNPSAPPVGVYAGAPYNPAGLSGAWNTVSADTTSGLLYADGTSAPGVKVDIGSDVPASGYAAFTGATNATSISAAALKTGIFDGTSPARTGLVASGGGVAMNLAGLGAGTYDVFVVGVNTNSATPGGGTVYAGGVASADVGFNQAIPTTSPYYLNNNFDYTKLSFNAALSNAAAGITSAWVEGQNYVEFTITLNAGDDLVLAAVGTTLPLNLVEIVPVAAPEPAAWAELGAAGGLFLLASARRRAIARG